ncbi:MAG: hypothetical protein QF501_02650 [Anaerolineales bacterium]|jgi:carbonic anhydrase|nr:hypothetical protein [Anaerolineales bacterium]
MKSNSFAAALNCIDGRTQIPVINFIKERSGVRYVDMITEAGIIKHLASNTEDSVVKATRLSVEISVSGHKTKSVFLVAHQDCLGNQVADKIQKGQLLQAKRNVEFWHLPVEVKCLWLNANWQAEEVSES